LRANERRKADLQAKLEHLDELQQAVDDFDMTEWIAEAQELLADTRNLLEADSEAGRQMLRRCLPHPLTITPDGEGWAFSGEGRSVQRDIRKIAEGWKDREIRGRVMAAPNPVPLEMVPPAGLTY
jgi:hypothetical protein